MARPTKFRNVEFFPKDTYFIPIGKPKCQIEEVVLKVEELEAMRLKDIEELKQEECAEKMQVSRQTFQNIIDSARKKVAIALTEGKAINISGGNYTTNFCKFKCLDCDADYDINYEQDKRVCPKCGSKKVLCNKKTKFCTNWCKAKNEE
ncbi:DUF134 domain-containing protein [Clostridium sp. YIM B02551]|uniref:DUF134 domain-containing protein n=1 Tax=Clostridium sp. YIM B02551 TaxID=2910679 RepID=UPI001EECA999|nr:DUF134 domain-containing protein [Clostridium sp. YIM B02551]